MTSFKNFQERKEYGALQRAHEKHMAKDATLMYKYGISLQQKIDMAKKQEWKCGNLRCSKELDQMNPSRIHVDHCHTSNKIRALLCNSCNVVLGYLEYKNKKTEQIIGLEEYIERHKISNE